MTATEAPEFVTPGHPAGCCCGECDTRRSHVEGAPGHQRCIEHGRCLECDGCEPCELDANATDEIGKWAEELPDLIRRAQIAVNHVRAGFTRLIDLYDIEIAEGPDGTDALHDLDKALRRLRNVKRIADARRAIAEREV
jgi:hypothetical protein